MVLDIIILLILLLTMISGFRRGFLYTFIRTLGWIGAMILAFFAAPYIKLLLMEHTPVYDIIFQKLTEKLSSSAVAVTASADTLPQLIGSSIHTVSNQAVQALASNLAGLFLIIVSFLLAFLLIKIIFAILTSIFSKKKNKGFTGFFDGLLGGIAGGIKGVIFIFIFLALLFPVVNLISPLSTEAVMQSLNHSHFARVLYDSNFIVVIINDFLNSAGAATGI